MLTTMCPRCGTNADYASGREGQTVPCRRCGAPVALRDIPRGEELLRSIRYAVWLIAVVLLVQIALIVLGWLITMASRPTPYPF